MKSKPPTSDEPGASLAGRRVDLLALTAIVALAVGLRAWRLNDRGLWFDEAFSWRLTTFDWGEMVRRAALDNNPPLYYLLLKLWTTCFGASRGAMRSLSALAGTAVCLATYLFVREAYRADGGRRFVPPDQARWTALVAAALVATSVLQIRWSWEARMYSLGALLAALSSWLLLRALHAPQAPSRWLAYAASALAFAYTHTFALFSLLAQGLYALGYLSRAGCQTADRAAALVAGKRRWAGPLLAAVAVAAAYAPWLTVLSAQHEQVRQSFWIGPLTRASVPKAAYALFVDPMETAMDDGQGWVWAGACAVVLIALMFRPVAADGLFFLSAAVPIGMAAAVSAWDTPIFYPRYFVFAELFLLAAVARLAGRVPGRPEKWIIAVVVLGSFLLIDYDFLGGLRAENSGGLRAAAESIVARRGPREPVVVCSPYFYLPMRYELGGAGCQLLDSGRPLPHFDGAAALTPHDFISAAQAARCGARRIWVVEGGGHAAVCTPPRERWQRWSEHSFFEPYGIVGALTVVEYVAVAGKKLPD